MFISSSTKLIIALLAAGLLTACGGGGGGSDVGSNGGGSSSVFQQMVANTYSGYTFVSRNINDNSSSSGAGCGVSTNVKDQAAVEAAVASLGGTILTSTPTKWCGIASGQTSCLIQADNVYVSDNRTAQSTTVVISMPGLVIDRKTVVNYDSQNSNPTIWSVSRDPTRTNSSNCPAVVSQSATAIDGNWTGYKATYNTNTKIATAATVSISCINQVCTLSDAPSSTISLSQPSNGTWTTSANAPKFAAAAISVDRQLLSVFVCSAPLIEWQALDSCGFYTFKR